MGMMENIMRAREARGRSPAFQAEMARENTEFMNVLKSLGSNTFDTGVAILLKTPTMLLLNALKAIHSKKYNFSNYSKDALKLLLSATHSTLKVAASAVHLAGQGAKIGVRQLFKV